MDKPEKQQNSEFDEANLLDIRKATVSLLDAMGFFAFKTMQYFAKKWVYIVLGLVVGLGSGYMKYSASQKMSQVPEFGASNELEYSILVAPQYNSIDYLDQLVQTKFRDKLNYTQIKTAKLVGIDDVFAFVSQDSLYTEVFEVLASKATTMDEAINFYTLSKNYPYQLLTIQVTRPFEIEKFVSDLQNHFNQQTYFAARKQLNIKNLAAEKDRLEEELNAITVYASLLQNKAQKGAAEQAQYLEVLNKKKMTIAQLAQIERVQLEEKQVLFVLDYIEKTEQLMDDGSSIGKQIAKDGVKFVLLFLAIGMLIDFVRYYKKRA